MSAYDYAMLIVAVGCAVFLLMLRAPRHQFGTHASELHHADDSEGGTP